jgi:RNA polymerase sigma-70 factor, ECF subfamily
MNVSQATDSELLKGTLRGDEQSLTELYRRRQGAVYRFALQMSGSIALAEDVTQEVFMVLMREGSTFDEARGSLNAFLLGIARNLVRQKAAREQFYVALDENAEDDRPTVAAPGVNDPFDNLIRNEMVEAVRRAVLSLPARYREVVVLCDLQELSYAEVADLLGCAVGTVRSRLHRARALLLEKLQPARAEAEAASAVVGSERCFA